MYSDFDSQQGKIIIINSQYYGGPQSRFDNDSEADTSNLRQWITQLQHDAEKENEPESCVMEGEIEFVDDNNLPRFLTRTENMEVSNAVLINPEKSVNTKKTEMKRKINAVDSINEKTQRETDAKFIFKNKRSKPSGKSEITQDMHLKNETLMLQKKLITRNKG